MRTQDTALAQERISRICLELWILQLVAAHCLVNLRAIDEDKSRLISQR